MSRRGILLFAALSVIWGMPYLLIKYAIDEINPIAMVFLRTLPAAVILLVVSAFRGKLRSNLKFWKVAAQFAVVEMVFAWWFVAEAERTLSSGLTGLLISTVPLFSVVIARIQGDQTAFAAHRLLGLAVGIIGVALLVGLDTADLQLSPVPVLMILLAAFGYALGPVLVANGMSQADAPTMIGMSMAVVSAIYLPLVPSNLPSVWPSATAIWAMVGLVVLCTVAAFLVFFALIAEIGPVRSTLITYVNPAVALVLGVVLLAEPITLGLVLGFPLVLAGSYLASRK